MRMRDAKKLKWGDPLVLTRAGQRLAYWGVPNRAIFLGFSQASPDTSIKVVVKGRITADSYHMRFWKVQE